MNATYEKWVTFALRLCIAAIFGLLIGIGKGEAWPGLFLSVSVFGLLLAQEKYLVWSRSHNDQLKVVLFWAGVGAFCGLVAAGVLALALGWKWWVFGIVAAVAGSFIGLSIRALALARPPENLATSETMFPTN